MRISTPRILFFLIPFFSSGLFLNIKILDFFLSILFFIISLNYYKSSILNKLTSNKTFLFLIFIIFLTGISLVRGKSSQSIISSTRHASTLLFFAIAIIILIYHSDNPKNLIRSFFKGSFIYIIAAFTIAYLFPSHNLTDTAISQVNRIGYNYSSQYTILTALYFSVGISPYLISATVLYFFFDFRKRKKVSSLIFAIFLIVILITSHTRVITISTLLLIGLLLFETVLKKINYNLIVFLPMIFFGLFYFLILIRIPFFSSSYLNTYELQTFNGRLYIWNSVFLELSNFQLNQLWGYGHFGNIEMQQVRIFQMRASTSANLLGSTTHNIYFQMIADMGYVFLLLFIYFVRLIFKKLKLLMEFNDFNILLFAIIIEFFMVGIGEAIWGYKRINLLLMILVFSYIIFEKIEAKKSLRPSF